MFLCTCAFLRKLWIMCSTKIRQTKSIIENMGFQETEHSQREVSVDSDEKSQDRSFIADLERK